MISPKLVGHVLTFETTHHKKHGNPELGPNNKYRVDFRSAKEARFNQISNPPKELTPQSGLKLTLRE